MVVEGGEVGAVVAEDRWVEGWESSKFPSKVAGGFHKGFQFQLASPDPWVEGGCCGGIGEEGGDRGTESTNLFYVRGDLEIYQIFD